MEDVVCIVALDTAGFIKTCTSCSRQDSANYTRYYRSIGYKSRVVTYEELEAMQQKEEVLRNVKI